MTKGQSSDPELLIPLLPSQGFENTRILVIGDLMLDCYILGDVNRISPEAPVPVLAVRQQRSVAGGAANVALNVAGLRAKAVVAGVVGDDSSGLVLTELLAQAGADVRAIVVDGSRPTTKKTRIVSGGQQLVRFDEEVNQDISPEVSAILLNKVLELMGSGISGVILSDYAKGVLSLALTRAIIREGEAKGIPVIVDPKRENYDSYAGATCITPNEKEFTAAIRAMQIHEPDLVNAGYSLRDRLHCSFLLVTQGANGMTLITEGHAYHMPALAEEVFDVSGAGDTVVSVFATALASRLDIISSVRLANVAASLVVRRAGTAPVRWDELYALLAKSLPVVEDLDSPIG